MKRRPRRNFIAALAGSATSLAVASAQKREPAGDIGAHSKGSRCRVLPLPDGQTAFECGDREVLRCTIRDATVEGITCFDHPDNPGFPSKWHVREDGWMEASFCMDDGRTPEPGQPLRLRYLLHAHRESVDGARAARIAEEFARAPFFAVTPSKAKHRQFELVPGGSVSG